VGLRAGNRMAMTAPDNFARRRHVLFTMLTACAWRDSPHGPTPIVAGLRQFLGGWLGIGRIVVGMARQRYDLQLTRYGEEGWRRAGGTRSRRRSGAEPWTADPAGSVGDSARPGSGGGLMQKRADRVPDG
jgi:hypothetical protein